MLKSYIFYHNDNILKILLNNRVLYMKYRLLPRNCSAKVLLNFLEIIPDEHVRRWDILVSSEELLSSWIQFWTVYYTFKFEEQIYYLFNNLPFRLMISVLSELFIWRRITSVSVTRSDFLLLGVKREMEGQKW